MHYTWDPKKAKSNLKKHGVGFEEAISVLESDRFILLLQETSFEEERFKAIGCSVRARCLVVVFCDRHEDEARIISARKANKEEMKKWHERK